MGQDVQGNIMILPVAIFPPPLYFAILQAFRESAVDVHEHYIKQSLRSRYAILSANGPLILSVPCHKRNHTPMHLVQIDDSGKWRNEHMKALESAYRRSPFFEHYMDGLETILNRKNCTLCDFGLLTIHWACGILNIEPPKIISAFQPYAADDLRKLLTETVSLPNAAAYHQCFEDRFPFTPGLSVLDMIFNLGPESEIYIAKASSKLPTPLFAIFEHG